MVHTVATEASNSVRQHNKIKIWTERCSHNSWVDQMLPLTASSGSGSHGFPWLTSTPPKSQPIFPSAFQRCLFFAPAAHDTVIITLRRVPSLALRRTDELRGGQHHLWLCSQYRLCDTVLWILTSFFGPSLGWLSLL
jgi:hypothetical protein